LPPGKCHHATKDEKKFDDDDGCKISHGLNSYDS